MGIRHLTFSYVLFPALMMWWKISVPILNEFLPMKKDVVLIHPGSEVQFDPNRSYLILDFIGLVERHGYEAEQFNVVTSDGYILGLHRISGGPGNPKAYGKPAVFLQHGITQTSDNWVLQGPKTDLAFLLVDAGYDVWMGNIRGNPYSQNHLWKNKSSESFWSFSFHEMALYDIPAFIDLILKVTGNEKLTYVGFSMGTTMSYILFSTIPEYNDKVDIVYNFAPVAYWNHGLARIPKIGSFLFDAIVDVIEYFDIKELAPQTAFLAEIGRRYCSDRNKITQTLCVHIICSFGLNCRTFNRTIAEYNFTYLPVSVSYLTLYHYLQNIREKSFQQLDYGERLNLMKYGQKEAPHYNLSKITVPHSIWYGNNDYYVHPNDARYLSTVLQNCTIQMVDDKKWNHVDFFFAKTVRKEVFDKLPLLMNKK